MTTAFFMGGGQQQKTDTSKMDKTAVRGIKRSRAK